MTVVRSPWTYADRARNEVGVSGTNDGLSTVLLDVLPAKRPLYYGKMADSPAAADRRPR